MSLLDSIILGGLVVCSVCAVWSWWLYLRHPDYPLWPAIMTTACVAIQAGKVFP